MTAPFSQIDHDDERINRIQQEIESKLNPLLADMEKPTGAWKSLTLAKPFADYGGQAVPAPSYRRLVDGSVMLRGTVSTTGGAAALSAINRGAPTLSAWLATIGAAVCTLPVAVRERRLFAAACRTYADGAESVAVAHLALAPAESGTESRVLLDGVSGVSGTSVAITKLSLEICYRD